MAELIKPAPSADPLAWVGNRKLLELWTATMPQAVIAEGVLLLPTGRRSLAINRTVEATIPEDFRARGSAGRKHAGLVAPLGTSPPR